MTIWTFNQAGSIPGVPGTFSGVTVDVDDATNAVLSVTPLAVHSEFVAALEDEVPIVDEEAKSKDTAPATVNAVDDTASEQAQP